MITAAPSTALVTIQPAFTDAERLTRAPRSGMTGPAAAWTGTRPTSSPPTSRVPPGNREGWSSAAWRPRPPGGSLRRYRSLSAASTRA